TRWHTEYWFPTDRALNIYELEVPQTKLRPVKKVPLFEWARAQEVQVWKALAEAYSGNGQWPEPPEIHQNLWAPSGMENLKPAFEKIISGTKDEKATLWKFYY